MKKVLLIMAALLLFAATPSRADVSDAISKIPDMKQGIVYDVDTNEFQYITTTPIMEKYGVTLEAGYASENALVGVISYKLLELKDYVSLPLLDLIELNLGYSVGVKRIGSGGGNNEYMHGPSLTLINVKF